MNVIDLPANLRRIRGAAGLTQDEVAQRADMHRLSYAALERGTNDNPGLKSLLRIADALGVSVSELLLGRSRDAAAGRRVHRTPRRRAAGGR